MRKNILLVVIGFLLGIALANAQQSLFIDDAASEHSFGIIAEEGGSVAHAFVIKNPTEKPMTIFRVVADCGCTTPQWTKVPVPAGKNTEIRVWFNPEGRPGTFVKYIKVFNSATREPIQLVIKGNVSTRGTTSASDKLFQQKIGPLLVSNTRLVFPLQARGQERVVRFIVNNPSSGSLHVTIDSIPPYLRLSKTSMILTPNEPDQIYISTQGTESWASSYYRDSITLTVRPEQGDPIEGSVRIELPLAEDFSNAEGPLPEATLKTYHRLGEQTTEVKELFYDVEIENSSAEPESKLHFFSVTSDDDAVKILSYDQDIASLQKGVISTSVNLDLLRREKRDLNANITLMTNDPKAPMRKIKLVLKVSM